MNNPFPSRTELSRQRRAASRGERAFEMACLATGIARYFLSSAQAIDWEGHEPPIGWDWADVMALMRTISEIDPEQHANAVTERAAEELEGTV